MRRLIQILALLLSAFFVQGQDIVPLTAPDRDSSKQDAVFTPPQAWLLLDDALHKSMLWDSCSVDLQEAMRRLLDQSAHPYDSALHLLSKQDFADIELHKGDPVISQSIPLEWVNDSTFLVDTQGWSSKLYLKKEMELKYPVDLSTLSLRDSSLLDANGMLDSTLFIADTIWHDVIDTAALRALEIGIHNYSEENVDPPLPDPGDGLLSRISEDRLNLEYYSPSDVWKADENSPFRVVESKAYLDSLQRAVSTLLDYNRERDSTLMMFNDLYGKETPFWIGAGREDLSRFWVKNFNDDSITLWIGNPAPNRVSLILEDEVNFSRLMKEEIHHLPSFIEPPERFLNKMAMLKPIPIYWNYEFASSLSMSQTYLSNWTKGGESTLSGMVDITGKATYNNTDAKTQWINMARLKFGAVLTNDKGFRKNNDQLELNSKFNRNAWGKIGLSASWYMKHQLAPGRKYITKDSSKVVSRFLNPGTMTIGLGAEYKPIEKTTINIAPLSYKTTFVFDTAHIDQTAHGIPKDQWAKSEMGMQVVISNSMKPTKGLLITNQVRLFSNYLNKPQNVDVDWEILMEQQVNWFFTIRLNLHFIYDDDVRFTVYDDSDTAILLPDGSEKKEARLQFKEFIGLSLNFKF